MSDLTLSFHILPGTRCDEGSSNGHLLHEGPSRLEAKAGHPVTS